MSIQEPRQDLVDRITKVIEDGNHSLDKITYALSGQKDEPILAVLNALSKVGYLEKIEDDSEGDEIRFYLNDTTINASIPDSDAVDADDVPHLPHDSEMSQSAALELSELPVNRDYDFEKRKPTDVPEFHQADGELDEIRADLHYNRQVAKKHGVDKAREPRFWFTGPTGCGKTHAARYIAQEEDAVVFTIQGKYSMNEADLLGMPLLINDKTIWVDGPLTKALLSSQERVTVLLIDEANRARPEAKSALFSVLDDRCEVELEAKGGELIQGDPMNLISFATVNEGDGYQTQKLDLAEMRRFGLKIPMTYLGIDNPQKEIDLVTERSMASEELATELVDAANKIREEASDAGEVKRGIPTALVIDWARTAYGYSASDTISNPVLRAAKAAIIRPFYSDDNDTYVEDTISDCLDGAPFDREELKRWAKKDMDEFVTQTE